MDNTLATTYKTSDILKYSTFYAESLSLCLKKSGMTKSEPKCNDKAMSCTCLMQIYASSRLHDTVGKHTLTFGNWINSLHSSYLQKRATVYFFLFSSNNSNICLVNTLHRNSSHFCAFHSVSLLIGAFLIVFDNVVRYLFFFVFTFSCSVLLIATNSLAQSFGK